MAASSHRDEETASLNKAVIGWIRQTQGDQDPEGYIEIYKARDAAADARVGAMIASGKIDQVPRYIIAQIDREEYMSPDTSITEKFFLSQAGAELVRYAGSSYYTKPGENEESRQDDALKIAKSVREVDDIPYTTDEWKSLAVRMYVNGVPYQVIQEIYQDGTAWPGRHPILDYYLDMAGAYFGEEDDTVLVEDTYAADIGHILHDVLLEYGDGGLPSSSDTARWEQIAAELEKFFVSEDVVQDILDDVEHGKFDVANSYLISAGFAPMILRWDGLEYDSEEEPISLQQLREAYMNDRISLEEYERGIRRSVRDLAK